MQYVCDAPPKTWFRIETEGEAALESRAMDHAVDRYFRQAYQQATETYVPPRSAHYIEQNIGLKAHVQRVMPIFLTLRDGEGTALVTAMLPPAGKDERRLQADHRRRLQRRSLTPNTARPSASSANTSE